MGTKMKYEVIKEMKLGNFSKVYHRLLQYNYSYTIDNFTTDFKQVSSSIKFCYLLYLIAKQESAYLHILICEFLMYTDTFFDDIYPIIYLHLKAALALEEDTIKTMSWIIDTFCDHPESPFDSVQMKDFATKVVIKYPDNVCALKILNDSF